MSAERSPAMTIGQLMALQMFVSGRMDAMTIEQWRSIRSWMDGIEGGGRETGGP